MPDKLNAAEESDESDKTKSLHACQYFKKCGGCDYQGISYEEQLKIKDRNLKKELKGLVEHIYPIKGMDDPLHYRCKVHAVFGRDRKGNVISGIYEKNSHKLVPVDFCMIEDENSDAIIRTVRGLLRSFKIRVYDEDTGYGLLRHVCVRAGFYTGQYMLILVLADPVFPSKNNFVKAVRKLHPEISTVVLNINDRNTSQVLGERNITLYGPGYIEDELCGCRFRISADSFFQINPRQTQALYKKALEFADIDPADRVLDTYCGTGTIGILAAAYAGSVTGVEQNRDAVKDAIINAKRNQVRNIRFINADATEYMEEMAEEKTDLIIMDPPRTGTTARFIKAAAGMQPDRIVYVSCNPETLSRDLKLFAGYGYRGIKAQPFDLFPFTGHIECCVLIGRVSGRKRILSEVR